MSVTARGSRRNGRQTGEHLQPVGQQVTRVWVVGECVCRAAHVQGQRRLARLDFVRGGRRGNGR